MPLPDTLDVQTFADRFKVQDVEFALNFMQQMSKTGGGETRYADRAPAMIRAKITTGFMKNAEAEAVMALINSRAGGLKSVLLYNYRLPYPSTDPGGTIIGAAAPTIAAIADRLHISFAGFPAGYELPLGTWFGVVFDTSRRYVGQLAEAGTANAAGAVPTVEIFPPLPASIAPGAVVSVSKPPAKFKLTPNSAFPSKADGTHSTIEFAAEQTYSR